LRPNSEAANFLGSKIIYKKDIPGDQISREKFHRDSKLIFVPLFIVNKVFGKTITREFITTVANFLQSKFHSHVISTVQDTGNLV
jgi:hypothetical protein